MGIFIPNIINLKRYTLDLLLHPLLIFIWEFLFPYYKVDLASNTRHVPDFTEYNSLQMPPITHTPSTIPPRQLDTLIIIIDTKLSATIVTRLTIYQPLSSKQIYQACLFVYFQIFKLILPIIFPFVLKKVSCFFLVASFYR